MADTLHSNLEADLRMASVLTREFELLLTDRFHMRATGAVRYAGSVNGMLSDTLKVRQAGLGGYDEFSDATAETEDMANTALTDSSYTLAVVRSGLVRKLGDLAKLTGFAGDPASVEAFTADMLEGFEGYFNGLVGTACAAATSTVGNSGSDMTTADFRDAIYTLEVAENSGPYFCYLASRQLADLQESATGLAGPAQWRTDTQGLLGIKNQGYAGNWLDVDIYKGSNVTTVGANKEGAMWAYGAIAYADGQPAIGSYGSSVVFANGPVAVEIQRTSTAAKTNIVGHGYCAVSIAQQGMICGINTDA